MEFEKITRTQVGTSCPYAVQGVSSSPCPTAKAVPHLSSSTLRRSSWTRCLSTLSVFPATSLRISPITSVTSSSKVASEALCRNSKSLLKARMFAFKAPSLRLSQTHLGLCGGLIPAISQAPTLILAHSPPHTGTGKKVGRKKENSWMEINTLEYRKAKAPLPHQAK